MGRLEGTTDSIRKYTLTHLVLMMLVLSKQSLEDVQLSEIFLKFICTLLLWKTHTPTL